MKALLSYIVEKIDIDIIVAFFAKARKYFVKWKKVPRKFLISYVFPFSYVCVGVGTLLLNLIWFYWFIKYFIYRTDEYSLSANASDAGRDYKLQFFSLLASSKLKVSQHQAVAGVVTYDWSFYMPLPFGLLVIFINILVGYFVYSYFRRIHQLEEDQRFLILLIFGLFGLFISWFCLGCLLTLLDGIFTHSFFNFTADDYSQSELVFEPYLISSLIKFKVVRIYTIPDLYEHVFLRHAKRCLEANAPEGLFDYRGDEIYEQFKSLFPYELVMDQGKYAPRSGDTAWRKAHESQITATLLEYSTPGWRLNSNKDIAPYFNYYPEFGYNFELEYDKFTVDTVTRAAEEAVSCFVVEDVEYNVMCRDHFTTPFQRTCRAWVAEWISMKYALDYYKEAIVYRYLNKGKLIRTMACLDTIISLMQGFGVNWYSYRVLKHWFNHDIKLWRFYYGERKRTWGRTPQGRKYNRYYYSSEWWGEKYMYIFYKNRKGKWTRGPQRPYKEPYEQKYPTFSIHYVGNFYDWRHW